jgi:membrane protease YdiL (CAAX protease family)
VTAILAGWLLIWIVLDRSAAGFESTRGEMGLAVAALVIGATLAVERTVFGARPLKALRALGFGWPGIAPLLAVSALCLALMAYYPLVAWLTSSRLGLRGDWLWLAPGLFAQAGIAEEVTFRGYLFRHLRQGRSFWRASVLAMIPFAAVHVLLFPLLGAPVALASILLAIAVSFPLAHLFEVGRGTIWLPAMVHSAVQGSIKIVEIPADLMAQAAVWWIAACAVVPYLSFLLPRPFRIGDSSQAA